MIRKELKILQKFLDCLFYSKISTETVLKVKFELKSLPNTFLRSETNLKVYKKCSNGQILIQRSTKNVLKVKFEFKSLQNSFLLSKLNSKVYKNSCNAYEKLKSTKNVTRMLVWFLTVRFEFETLQKFL